MFHFKIHNHFLFTDRYSEDVRNNRNKQISPESHKISSKKENAPKVHHSDNEDRAERKEEDEFDKSLFKEEQVCMCFKKRVFSQFLQ